MRIRALCLALVACTVAVAVAYTPNASAVGNGLYGTARTGQLHGMTATTHCAINGELGVCSPPEWFPLRHGVTGGTFKLTCVMGNPGCPGYHKYWALDIGDRAYAPGAPVYAAGAGRVVAAVSGNTGTCGKPNFVEVQHGDSGVFSWYYHLNTVGVEKGAWVTENTRIGTVGATGQTEPCGYNHLHFQVTSGIAYSSQIYPGSLKACHGGSALTYPEALGYSSWNDVPSEKAGLYSDGTLCRYVGHIVQLQGAPSRSWLVGADLQRHWIVDGATYDCLTGRGDAVDAPYSSAVLDQLPVAKGSWATCGGPPFEGSIVRRSDGASWVILDGTRHFVPDYPTDLCSQFIDGRKASFTGVSSAAIQSIPASTPYVCGLGRSILTADDQPNPKPSYAFYSGKRHWIPDGETYGWLVAHGYSRVVHIPTEQAILGLADGGTEQPRITPPDNTIVRESQISSLSLSPVSWVVKGGLRYLIPDNATDFCARYRNGLSVSRTGVDAAVVAASFPDSGKTYSCGLANTVLRALDKPDPKPSYAFYSGKRHWIPDGWTYSYLLKHGFTKLDVPTDGAIQQLPDGGTEPAKLDPSDIPANTIVRRSDGVSWIVDANHIRHHIPYAQDDVCWRDLRGYSVSATGLTYNEANEVGTEADAWPCIIGDRVVRSSDGSSWRVDTNNSRHWIPDTDTYWYWARRIPVVGPWPAADVNQIPQGSNEPYRIDPADVANTIICRNDGICWAVDGGGTRHHIPTYADNVCWRWVNGWHVSRNGLNYDQANSLPEGSEWGCTMNNVIVATTSGASYYLQGNVRHWIQDPESYYCYRDNNGAGVITGMSYSELQPVSEGSWMPQCLSTSRVRNHIVRASDGTAYFVDANEWWHWIPNGTVWGCLTSRYDYHTFYSMNWTQINSIKREGAWANCSM